MHRIELDSGWQVRWADYQRHASPWAATDKAEASWRPAVVPGDVHLDLMRDGVIPDPFVKCNTDACLWMEQVDFWYRREIQVPAAWLRKKQSAIKLLFHGLDCFATVYWDGVAIASHANMFTPLEVDITARAKAGRTHVLTIRLAAPLFEPLKRHANQHAVATTWGFPRHISRKAQMSYGWDIAPRLVTTGIWRPVELICVDRARMENVWVRTRKLSMSKRAGEERTATRAQMEAQVTVEAVAGAAGEPLTVELAVEPPAGAGAARERRVFTQALAALSAGAVATATFQWTVENPQLWWPNGSGDPKLYGYTVRLRAGATVLDEKRHHFGIRTVKLDRSKTKDGGHRYAFVINRREIFVRGWNWTPPDAIFVRITTERRETLVRVAAESGANMLRVWGGGYYEPREFFDACDKAGLLVHQDFMMACAEHPQTAAFQAELRAEAEHIVKAYRSHSCLALWSGDNECDAMYKVPRKNVLTRNLLPAVLKRLDPDTPYIPSSPDSPNQREYNDRHDSDVHLWNHGADYRSEYFMGVKAKFVSEIGYLSLPGLATAQAMHADLPAWPADNAIWDHHAADTMRGKLFRGMPHVLKNFASCKRKPPKSLGEYIRVSQELQAEAYKTWTLHFGAMPECAGILLWNLADCWPQMSDAVIAYPMDVKPALAAAAGAFQAIGRR